MKSNQKAASSVPSRIPRRISVIRTPSGLQREFFRTGGSGGSQESRSPPSPIQPVPPIDAQYHVRGTPLNSTIVGGSSSSSSNSSSFVSSSSSSSSSSSFVATPPNRRKKTATKKKFTKSAAKVKLPRIIVGRIEKPKSTPGRRRNSPISLLISSIPSPSTTIVSVDYSKPCIPRAAFKRVVNDILRDENANLRMSKESLEALQEGSEAHLIKLFTVTNILARNAKRKTIQVHDWDAAMEIDNMLSPNPYQPAAAVITPHHYVSISSDTPTSSTS